jgi:hypothetical protein
MYRVDDLEKKPESRCCGFIVWKSIVVRTRLVHDLDLCFAFGYAIFVWIRWRCVLITTYSSEYCFCGLFRLLVVLLFERFRCSRCTSYVFVLQRCSVCVQFHKASTGTMAQLFSRYVPRATYGYHNYHSAMSRLLLIGYYEYDPTPVGPSFRTCEPRKSTE